jgi:ABC-type multidrug transport system permease subunit
VLLVGGKSIGAKQRRTEETIICKSLIFFITILIVSSLILGLFCSFIMFVFRRTMGNQTQPMSQT